MRIEISKFRNFKKKIPKNENTKKYFHTKMSSTLFHTYSILNPHIFHTRIHAQSILNPYIIHTNFHTASILHPYLFHAKSILIPRLFHEFLSDTSSRLLDHITIICLQGNTEVLEVFNMCTSLGGQLYMFWVSITQTFTLVPLPLD